jgi:hypothetical protein
MLTPILSSFIGVLLLCFGILAGLSDIHVPYRTLHLSIASTYILLTPLIIYVHINRFYVKGPTDWIAWLHFIIFSFILYLTVKMIKRWLPTKTSHFTEKLIIKNNGNTYDLTDWVDKHPGGRANIMKIFKKSNNGKELEEIWRDEGVGWHNENKRIQSALEKYRI